MMYQVLGRVQRLPAVLAASAIVATSLLVAPGSTFAAGTCPLPSVLESGSTTVYPALQAGNSALQTALGCSVSLVASGSGAGINDAISGASQIAASSTPLSGTQPASLYAWQIGGDAMVIAMNANTAASLGVTQITKAQVAQIWTSTAAGGVSNWSSFGYGSGTIVPRGRDGNTSGSYKDFYQKFGITQTAMDATITATGLPLLQTSQDEATAACNDPSDIVYTSLANLQAFGPAGQGCLVALALSADGSAGSYVMPTVTSVQTGTYPVPRQLFLVMKKWSLIGSATTTDSSAEVKAQDMLNFYMSSAGQAFVGQAGFVPGTIPAAKPIPDFDVNLDGAVGLGDIGNILGRWGATSPCKGWIRADVANQGAVGLSGIGQVLAHWGQKGFVAP
jgi:ABC-type phosphate transport system substrate-binding protein